MSVSLFAREKEVGFLAWTLYAPNFSLLLFFFLWKLMAYKLLYYVHTFLLRLVLERNKHWRMIVEGRLRCARFTNEQCTMRFITLHRQIYIACIRKISRIKRPVANIANVKIPAREKMATEMKRRAHQFGRHFCNLFWVDGGGGGEGGGWFNQHRKCRRRRRWNEGPSCKSLAHDDPRVCAKLLTYSRQIRIWQ